ncbi:flagellar motor switch phosphatase FliY [Clostridium sp. FP2]|uniref:flagellar motor switch phosphatase FliY n=1 Tax=Clostridium TaxID=1485 RepID=UPI0013E940FC|nr:MULTISPECIES: flagellar motor switch phosphatase FliY [Clostridium]MBW9154978.1 flagellar motor switch phosphatase FliY [Clostridium tagluense]MBZ9624590.1 flagellar motor switch phosphatase FliY [Clostridium sp. FP2]WLC64430.1 flagellar motor switch phosphatase FliY [Clostridium tagluense]
MSNGFLSQEEIDALLNGGDSSSEPIEKFELSDIEKDLLGEVGNISMGSASTALSTIVGQQVNIATPIVSVSTLRELRANFEVPNIALDVKFVSGIAGGNLLVMKTPDAAVIASLMMGGDGKIEGTPALSEIEISAVSEAMNQMIGSAATSMATMFAREVNISPPESKIWDDSTSALSDSIDEDEQVVQVAFKMTIGDLIDSVIMQVLPIETAKKIVAIMMGTEQPAEAPKVASTQSEIKQQAPVRETAQQEAAYTSVPPQPEYYAKPIERPQPQVEVRQASFVPLTNTAVHNAPRNIDLILDVPLEISVVLGKTKKNIRDILNLGTGSLIELDKLAEEPVDILVNGKKVAYGEVVVVDENFGVRITSIISGEERVKAISE